MPESEEEKNLIGKTIASNKYKLTQFVGSGTFSVIYKVKEVNGSKELVAKLESKKTESKQLSHEFAIYQILRKECNHWSIPKTYFFGEFRAYLVLILDLLGPTLALKFEECGEKFSVKTVSLLAIQMIDILQYIHSRRVIFRDVKPENFLLGLPKTPKESKLHIIDFGLSKEYKDRNGVHIKDREGVGMTGTARYMSINTHSGREQSRRDDMETVGHMLIYFLKGKLPWMGLDIQNRVERFAKIGEIKRKTKPEKLCSDLPQEFCKYLITVRALGFTEEPNYKNLKEMFKKLLSSRGEDRDETYDWNDKHKKNKDINNPNENKPKTISNMPLKVD